MNTQTHAKELGLARHASPERGARATLTEKDVLEIRQLGASGMFQRDIAKRYGVRHQTIGLILRGERWKHVAGPRSLRGHAGEFNGRYKGKRQGAFACLDQENGVLPQFDDLVELGGQFVRTV